MSAQSTPLPGSFAGLSDRAFRTFATLAVILVAVLMIAAGLQFSRDAQRGRELREAVNRSYETRSQMQAVFSTLQDAETGQRGFVITQSPAFLQPYRTAVASVDGRLDALEALLAQEPDQKRRLARLRVITRAKFAEMARVLAAMDQSGPEAARSAVAEGTGMRTMDEARRLVAEMIRAEALSLEARVAEEQARARAAERIVFLLFALVAATLAAAAALIFVHARSRRALLARAEDAAARQRAILDSATDGIITLNRSGTVESINAAGLRMFGWSAGEIGRRDLSTLLRLEDEPEGVFVARLLGPGRDGAAREMVGLRSDGTTFPAEVAVSEMHLPDGLRLVAIVRDIGERRRTERLKDEFVSTVSHELRTPLTSIAGSLGLVTGGAAGELPERARRLITIAETNCQRLVRLINDILDIEKMESGKIRFDLRPTPLGEIAARSIEEVRGFADGFGVRLRLEQEGSTPIIRGDADRLVQVTVNLLSNAAKFSPAGSDVIVVIGSSEDTARLSVYDRGPGVPETFRRHIFGKFAQADGSDTRQKGGTGLGLAIAKEIMERHGGALTFDNLPEGGAVFRMELPKVGEHMGEQGVRLMVCEDEVVTAAALREVLEDEGFIVDITETLADAEQAIRRQEYACLVMDLKLPDGDGFALIRRLHADGERRIPIIVVSGDAARRREQARSLALDVVAWMGKPVDPARLKDAILSALAAADGRKPVILHVDDDRDMLQITAAALSGCGEVVGAPGLAAAREFLAHRTPDLVILDLGLADGSGLDLLPDLTDAEGRAIPVVVFSAQDADQQLSTRVDSVLTKSRTSLSALARTVRRLTRTPPAPASEREREIA
jgi:PAS domain S-box-containing protein